MRRFTGALVLVAALAACTEAGEETDDAVGTPTALPSEVQQALCDAQGQVIQAAEDVRSGDIQTREELITELEGLSADLEDQASQLEEEAPEAAATVRDLAESVTRLQDAVERADTSEAAAAADDVADAAADLPGCPTA